MAHFRSPQQRLSPWTALPEAATKRIGQVPPAWARPARPDRRWLVSPMKPEPVVNYREPVGGRDDRPYATGGISAPTRTVGAGSASDLNAPRGHRDQSPGCVGGEVRLIPCAFRQRGVGSGQVIAQTPPCSNQLAMYAAVYRRAAGIACDSLLSRRLNDRAEALPAPMPHRPAAASPESNSFLMFARRWTGGDHAQHFHGHPYCGPRVPADVPD